MDRRWFLGASAGFVILSATRASHAGSDRIGDIGVQLYTVRGELERDFEGTQRVHFGTRLPAGGDLIACR